MEVVQKSFCCWVNVLKIVVKFIGYENLMICKVADKREAPSGGRQPTTTRRGRKTVAIGRKSVKGFSAFIEILIFAFSPSPMHLIVWV